MFALATSCLGQAAQPNAGAATIKVQAYKAWNLRCQTAVQPQVCEVQQSISVKNNQGQQNIVARLAFDRMAASNGLRLTAILPVDILLPSSVKIRVSAKDQAPVELAWQRCVPAGCVAQAELAPNAVQKLHAAAQLFVSFRSAQGQEVNVSTSPDGLAAALDALLQ
jgi:invasion protein IalB